MATSGITDFEQTRNEIVRSAYENCRVAIDGEELSAEQLTKGVRVLNRLLKHWQNQGFHMWKLPEAWLFAQKGQAEYKLGKNGDFAGYNVKKNQMAFPVYGGFNQFYLKINQPFPDEGDFIVIVTPCGFFKSTVTEVNDYAVKINDILPPCGACCGADVYFFKNKIDRPLKILQARRYLLGGNDIELLNLENAEYFRLPQKEQQGTPTSWTYVPTLNEGTFYLWNTPDANNCIIKFTYEQAFDIFENSKETPDITQEWLEALVWELSYRLSASCGLDLNEREWLKAQAKETLAEARIFDQETGGFQIVPDYKGY